MARPSPGTHRVISTLNYFAESPGQAFTLTDLVRALDLNRATCHSLLAELTEAGYLYRASDKSYVLGPAVARLGRAASAQVSPFQIALPEMRSLAERHDVIGMALTREDRDVVVKERVASLSHLDLHLPRGSRLPLRPPFGAVFLAWSEEKATERWFAQLDPPASAHERELTLQGMAFTREHGFQFVVRTPVPAPTDLSLETLLITDPALRPLQTGTRVDDDETYNLSSMSAPVFGGGVAFAISLTGFTGLFTGAEIKTIAGTLRDACQRISHFMGAPARRGKDA